MFILTMGGTQFYHFKMLSVSPCCTCFLMHFYHGLHGSKTVEEVEEVEEVEQAACIALTGDHWKSVGRKGMLQKHVLASYSKPHESERWRTCSPLSEQIVLFINIYTLFII